MSPHEQEHEAYDYAIKAMRESQIPVPRKALQDAKYYVRMLIEEEAKEGYKIQSRTKRWAMTKKA